MSNEALILDLAASLTPVKRRSALRDALWLAALAVAEAALLLLAGAMRPDMGRMILSSDMIWKVGTLALLAAVSGVVAIRSFVPPAPPRAGRRLALSLGGLAIVGGIFVASAADRGRPLLERLSPVHGLLCTASIIVLALPMVAMLAVLMRRAAPVRPERSAVAAGFAAAASGALVFTICCPMNDPVYIAVWYSVGAAIVTAIARWILPRRFHL